MSETNYQSRKAVDIQVGEPLTPLELPMTSTLIVAGALATRDFMPVHHDRDYAQAQGAPDIFMNIFSTNGYVARFVTDWAGPEAMLKNINIRLGVPAIPKQALRFTGEVLSKEIEGDEVLIEVSVNAANEMGNHATGSAKFTLPA